MQLYEAIVCTVIGGPTPWLVSRARKRPSHPISLPGQDGFRQGPRRNPMRRGFALGDSRPHVPPQAGREGDAIDVGALAGMSAPVIVYALDRRPDDDPELFDEADRLRSRKESRCGSILAESHRRLDFVVLTFYVWFVHGACTCVHRIGRLGRGTGKPSRRLPRQARPRIWERQAPFRRAAKRSAASNIIAQAPAAILCSVTNGLRARM